MLQKRLSKAFKMVSTLSQKWLTNFAKKKRGKNVFCTVRFCSSFTSLWSKYISNNVWRDFRLPMSGSVIIGNGNILVIMLDRNINFCSKFAMTTPPCYRCKFWHCKSKVSPNIGGGINLSKCIVFGIKISLKFQKSKTFLENLFFKEFSWESTLLNSILISGVIGMHALSYQYIV